MSWSYTTRALSPTHCTQQHTPLDYLGQIHQGLYLQHNVHISTHSGIILVIYTKGSASNTWYTTAHTLGMSWSYTSRALPPTHCSPATHTLGKSWSGTPRALPPTHSIQQHTLLDNISHIHQGLCLQHTEHSSTHPWIILARYTKGSASNTMYTSAHTLE